MDFLNFQPLTVQCPDQRFQNFFERDTKWAWPTPRDL